MKKLKVLLSVVAMSLVMVGCGGGSDDSDGGNDLDNNSIVGSWEFEGGFDGSAPQMLTFYDNGEYIQYNYHTLDDDCHEDDEPLEVGTYTLTGNLLSIDSHIQNGCGGFDDEAGDPPSSPIEVSFNEDGSSFTFVSWGATLTRVD